MDQKNIIDFLNKEREYHSSHPHEVFTKFFYSMGASLAAVLSALYFSGKVVKAELSKFVNDLPVECILMLFLLGHVSIIVGLLEHSFLHQQQRKKIEDVINHIFANYENFNYQDFWKKFGSTKLRSLGNKTLKTATPLITSEPDTRPNLTFHDRKIELGISLILIAYAMLIYYALK